jgi:hypothetical protein
MFVVQTHGALAEQLHGIFLMHERAAPMSVSFGESWPIRFLPLKVVIRSRTKISEASSKKQQKHCNAKRHADNT